MSEAIALLLGAERGTAWSVSANTTAETIGRDVEAVVASGSAVCPPVAPKMKRDAEEPVTGQFLSPRPKMLLGGMLILLLLSL